MDSSIKKIMLVATTIGGVSLAGTAIFGILKAAKAASSIEKTLVVS